MLDYISQCLANLSRKRMRTLLTVLSIAIGVASVVLTQSVGNAGLNMVSEEMQSLGMDGILISKNPQQQIPFAQKELTWIKNQNHIAEAIPVMTAYTQIKMRHFVAKTFVWGIDGGESQVISMDPIYGRLLHSGDIREKRKVCVVDRNAAHSFYSRGNIVGKHVDISVNGTDQRFLVIGIVNSGGDIFQNIAGSYSPGFIYIPYTTMQELTGKQDFNQIAVKVTQGTDPQILGENLLNQLNQKAQKDSAYQMENMSQHREELNSILKAVSTVISAVAAISLFVSGLGVMTIMLVSVKERTREIGIKKSLGATRQMIMREFMIEAVILSLAGSLFGTGIGAGIATLADFILGIPIPISLGATLFCIALTVFLGIAFGVYPSYQASRLFPVEALRLE